ncbi:hypothetical protein B0H16DRAFT_1764256 [Mycena metata]|uniref:Uncharacterized protein n=1 Tax=Mycena metata TaxID=1033252 RepID=A0AAD7MWP7_9AGAR|nr:hypothetical protein B0H16DRAFT_1764256 [Mycena metata]
MLHPVASTLERLGRRRSVVLTHPAAAASNSIQSVFGSRRGETEAGEPAGINEGHWCGGIGIDRDYFALYLALVGGMSVALALYNLYMPVESIVSASASVELQYQRHCAVPDGDLAKQTRLKCEHNSTRRGVGKWVSGNSLAKVDVKDAFGGDHLRASSPASKAIFEFDSCCNLLAPLNLNAISTMSSGILKTALRLHSCKSPALETCRSVDEVQWSSSTHPESIGFRKFRGQIFRLVNLKGKTPVTNAPTLEYLPAQLASISPAPVGPEFKYIILRRSETDFVSTANLRTSQSNAVKFDLGTRF